MEATRQKIKHLKAGFEPKAIYVCRTNISQDDGTPDLPSRPFTERRAPPILIWRYLIEHKGIDPTDVAVYCDLKFDRTAHPPPLDFKLFSGGEEDFAVFSAGNYKHIIFNLSLQEGWDDPACCFAYIDKSMGSRVAVEQVIGRVIRQPGAQHFPDPALNTGTFFIRVDDNQEFPRILKLVQDKLGAELPQRSRQEPKQTRRVPEIHIDASEAVDPLQAPLRAMHDYTKETTHTVGRGELLRALLAIGSGSKPTVETIDIPHSNRVTARWIVRRNMQSLFLEAAKAIDWADGRFDARVEITSVAATALRETAEKLVDAYVGNSELVFEQANLYSVAAVQINPRKAKRFKHALHDSYDLNTLEEPIADAIDDTGLPWVRNPSNGGYRIPLLDKGDSLWFYPDFLIWKHDLVFALDPKGGHLIFKDAGRKLLDIRDEKGQRKLLVRLITEGKWNEHLQKVGPGGYTVWSVFRSTSKLRARTVATVADAVDAALKP